MYIVYTNEHESLAVTQNADAAYRFALHLMMSLGVMADIRRSE